MFCNLYLFPATGTSKASEPQMKPTIELLASSWVFLYPELELLYQKMLNYSSPKKPFMADHSLNNFSSACFLFRLCMVHILVFGCLIQMRSKSKYRFGRENKSSPAEFSDLICHSFTAKVAAAICISFTQ